MSKAIKTQDQNQEVIQKLVLDGDISKMSPPQKVLYYNQFCQSLGLNPLTQPFQIIKFQGKERLYATKDCTEQLRKIHGVSITDLTTDQLSGVFVVTAKAKDKEGKTDAATGAVPIEGLKGDTLANALMKAETKAKRRVTLSICGLGILDEAEIDTMPGAKVAPVTEDVPFTYTESSTDNFILDWEVEIKTCKDESDLVRLYNGNKATVDQDPRLKQLFTQRKNEIRDAGLTIKQGNTHSSSYKR